MTENAAVESSWVRICSESELEENWGEVALVKGQQYAIFKTKHGYYACDHRDPNSQSLVIARGIVGEKDGHSTIASPLYKEVYDLTTGECVSGADYTIGVYPLEVRDGDIYLQV
ncbi:nitrite reductase small subunit NirD [Rothia dentocariosa]|uniref:nitrite reductase small subunit NirD n=1 Tax=Rothia dentocariosa TaxID=2047 RepID=UPI00195886C9|nr:nitrite reductase small subunit NirD [Rothia dentocariosa]VTY11866.1 Nitrite reductase (NADH) small subunit [Rothia dentocariosa]